MKTFKNLEFKIHKVGLGKSAKQDFDNGYGVSVICGEMFYTSEAEPYEVAVLLKGSLCYTSGITEDVIGYCTVRDVTKIMKKVQALPPVD